jgi:hypothetical protein
VGVSEHLSDSEDEDGLWKRDLEDGENRITVYFLLLYNEIILDASRRDGFYLWKNGNTAPSVHGFVNCTYSNLPGHFSAIPYVYLQNISPFLP